MDKPITKNYCTPFTDELVLFDSKQYAKDARKYIEYLEGLLRTASYYLAKQIPPTKEDSDKIMNAITQPKA
jgi:hypothetical protein